MTFLCGLQDVCITARDGGPQTWSEVRMRTSEQHMDLRKDSSAPRLRTPYTILNDGLRASRTQDLR